MSHTTETKFNYKLTHFWLYCFVCSCIVDQNVIFLWSSLCLLCPWLFPLMTLSEPTNLLTHYLALHHDCDSYFTQDLVSENSLCYVHSHATYGHFWLQQYWLKSCHGCFGVIGAWWASQSCVDWAPPSSCWSEVVDQ